MNPIIQIIWFLLIADYAVGEVPSNSITCYRCNNGYIASPKCVNAPAEGSGKDVQQVKSSVEEECMTVTEFFAKHNMITNEWIKRSIKKGRGRSSEVGGNGTMAGMQAYCATIIVYATNYQAIPQTYRDCVKGTPEEVKRNMITTFEYVDQDFAMPEPGGPNKCNKKKVGSERGTKVVNICLCQSDKCNKDKAKSSGSLQAAVYPFVLTFLYASLLNYIQ